MRKLLWLIPLLCSPAWGAVAHVIANQGFCSGSAGGNVTSGACSGSTFTFTFTASNTGDAVFFTIYGSTTSTTNVASLSASGWTFTVIPCTGATNCTSGTFGTSNNRAAAFWAYAPNTSLVTITGSFGGVSAGFMGDLEDEFSGVDGTNAVSASTAIAGSGSCSASVTPGENNDGLWGICVDSVTAVGSGFTKGGDDTQQDWSEWKILSGGSGVSQTVNFTGSGTFQEMAVAIKAASSVTPGTTFSGGKSFSGGKVVN